MTPLTKAEKGYDFEHSNIVFDEFLKFHKPLTDEEFKHRVALDSQDGKRLGRALAVYDNGLMAIAHHERNFRGDIQIQRKFFEISEIASFNEFNNQLIFKNLGVSFDVDSNISSWVKASMRASEQYKRQPPQPPATPKAHLEQPQAEPTQSTAYKPRF